VSQIGSMAFRPKVPKDNVVPLFATDLILPFCAFLCLVLFGCNMIV
jgi:hypothetical protein